MRGQLAREGIYLDLDRDRLKEITAHAINFIKEYTGYTLRRSDESLLEELENLISSNRVAQQIYLDVSSDWCPDLMLRVDFRRRKVLSLSDKWPRRKNSLNSFLRTL